MGSGRGSGTRISYRPRVAFRPVGARSASSSSVAANTHSTTFPPPCAATWRDGGVDERAGDRDAAGAGREREADCPVLRRERVAARHVRERDVVDQQPEGVRTGLGEVAPHRVAERGMTSAGCDLVVDPVRTRSRRSAKPLGGTATTVGVDMGRGYPRPMARPRGARTRADEVVRRLRDLYPDVRCALDHRNAFELLVATILSAQTTDERVNMVTPALFAKYPTAADLADADPADVEQLISRRDSSARRRRASSAWRRRSKTRYDGEVPSELDDLVTLPGVGRKTGNVVRSVWFGLPGLPVDTHVTRLSHRLKLTNETDPVKIELDLNGIVAARRTRASSRCASSSTAVASATPGARAATSASSPTSARRRARSAPRPRNASARPHPSPADPRLERPVAAAARTLQTRL